MFVLEILREESQRTSLDNFQVSKFSSNCTRKAICLERVWMLRFYGSLRRLARYPLFRYPNRRLYDHRSYDCVPSLRVDPNATNYQVDSELDSRANLALPLETGRLSVIPIICPFFRLEFKPFYWRTQLREQSKKPVTFFGGNRDGNMISVKNRR